MLIIWISGISYLVISYDMEYDITIYRAISCDVKPDHPKTSGLTNVNENPPPFWVLFVFGSFSVPSSWIVSRLAFFVVLRLSISWTHHRTDRTTGQQQPCPLTARPAT